MTSKRRLSGRQAVELELDDLDDQFNVDEPDVGASSGNDCQLQGASFASKDFDGEPPRSYSTTSRRDSQTIRRVPYRDLH